MRRSRRPGKVGDLGIPAGLGERAGCLRGAGMICAERRGGEEPVPAGQRWGHRGGGLGKNRKGAEWKECP